MDRSSTKIAKIYPGFLTRQEWLSNQRGKSPTQHPPFLQTHLRRLSVCSAFLTCFDGRFGLLSASSYRPSLGVSAHFYLSSVSLLPLHLMIRVILNLPSSASLLLRKKGGSIVLRCWGEWLSLSNNEKYTDCICWRYRSAWLQDRAFGFFQSCRKFWGGKKNGKHSLFEMAPMALKVAQTNSRNTDWTSNGLIFLLSYFTIFQIWPQSLESVIALFWIRCDGGTWILKVARLRDEILYL